MSEAQRSFRDYYKEDDVHVREQKPSLFERLRNRFPFLGTKRGIAVVVAVVLLIIGGGLAGLAALPRGNGGRGGSDADGLIKDDAYFYGQSPAVSLTGGVPSKNGCAGTLPAVERLGFPGLCLHDAGQGLRATDFVNAYPAGIHAGASWNRNLTLHRARAMGGEFRKKGVNVLLGPSVGPVGRVVRGGRNWESFSVDPYLAGALTSETIRGVQGAGVITSTKHFIANEQETHRMQKMPREAVSSNVDDRTMHELYLWPFYDAVKAGTGNVMCSYQRINNSYGCQNSKSLNGLLKTELGFQGWVVSDWDAQHAGTAAALAGMDVAMPVPRDFWGDHLVEAVRNGSVSEARVTDMVVRVLASWYRMGQDEDFPAPGVGMPKDMREPHRIVDARNSSSRQVLLDGAVEGHVLVKNVNRTLPLREPRLLSVFGYSARAADEQTGQGGGFPDSLTFGAQPISWQEVEAGFTMNEDFDWSGIGFNGTLISGGGSGAPAASTLVSPMDSLKAQANKDGTALQWDFTRGDPSVHPASDACLVLGNAWASESYDRPDLYDNYTDGLILHVAQRCASTIVVLHNAGPRLVDQWIDHANITAVLFAHLPGQASGTALTALLYGRANPSGKLPYTVARNESDYGAVVSPDLPDARHKNFPQSNFTEGVYIDYRHFDREERKPRFPFGFGLSYTTFAYGNLTVASVRNASTRAFAPARRATRRVGPSALWGIFRPGYPPERDQHGLRRRAPRSRSCSAARVEFALTRRDLSIWDVEAQGWRLQDGTYGVWVGGNSRDLPLRGNLTVVN
ncbi:beta-glucosidase [Verticillium alfalfae VaMs.102]|uniref:Beta-glucosidase cel3A n=1 Tax=Verticillium alfalfae (strain VaMs.102 / ATCC MYA-4576 / FGSC 10136) TaxID=526221 RepID=C9S6A6_VERA1|nr:beta-glucosidase [Verticillium alfalfae VaMs.102]EEY14418.1 beta-glucosidase [Verticillium alfalfae VaMs.102]